MADKSAGQVAYEVYRTGVVAGEGEPTWEQLPQYLHELWEAVAAAAHEWFIDNPINDD